jgi:tRNA (cmo5U34)-methyltransferase
MIAEYQNRDHALAYLAAADAIPNRTHGERMVLDLLPAELKTVLDLGTGDGRLLALVKLDHPDVEALAVDFSPTMLEAARSRFSGDGRVRVVKHDLNQSVFHLGRFDAVVSSFAIHHVEDDRKRDLYREIFEILEPGGVFCNLEHVSSPTERLHEEFLAALAFVGKGEDKSNRCSPVELQLSWLREIGFEDVDCYWKWRELAVLAGRKPG